MRKNYFIRSYQGTSLVNFMRVVLSGLPFPRVYFGVGTFSIITIFSFRLRLSQENDKHQAVLLCCLCWSAGCYNQCPYRLVSQMRKELERKMISILKLFLQLDQDTCSLMTGKVMLHNSSMMPRPASPKDFPSSTEEPAPRTPSAPTSWPSARAAPVSPSGGSGRSSRRWWRR